eukprot:TRINITY_DN2289_c0_g1_i1.p1 TRINITY_DN2289_c0_g1~~TRINITY_DN2289_c0_g1_i1.p1  ORF type:complete len:73 (-),score=6.64 TRINITY_DN2289_c0_g1_i1:90-308(-)
MDKKKQAKRDSQEEVVNLQLVVDRLQGAHQIQTEVGCLHYRYGELRGEFDLQFNVRDQVEKELGHAMVRLSK